MFKSLWAERRADVIAYCAAHDGPVFETEAWPSLDGHIEMAGRVGDFTMHRQIGGDQKVVRVRLHEQVERLPPVSLGGRVTYTLDEPRPASSLIARLPNPVTDRNPGSTGAERNRQGYRRNSLAHAPVMETTTSPNQQDTAEESS